jgi:hypothetical protein
MLFIDLPFIGIIFMGLDLLTRLLSVGMEGILRCGFMENWELLFGTLVVE